MIEGWITGDDVPQIELPIAGASWMAVVDTGFNGYMELPQALLEQLDAEYQGEAFSLLAGGQSISEKVYLIDIQFDGDLRTAEVSFAASDTILLGTKLLSHHQLVIDFPGKGVTLSKRR
ncbi:MAG: hypothetical protein AB7U20_19920 [Planctomycetaceae bacterium]